MNNKILAIVGEVNSGKSSLINMIFEADIAKVSFLPTKLISNYDNIMDCKETNWDIIEFTGGDEPKVVNNYFTENSRRNPNAILYVMSMENVVSEVVISQLIEYITVGMNVIFVVSHMGKNDSIQINKHKELLEKTFIGKGLKHMPITYANISNSLDQEKIVNILHMKHEVFRNSIELNNEETELKLKASKMSGILEANHIMENVLSEKIIYDTYNNVINSEFSGSAITEMMRDGVDCKTGNLERLDGKLRLIHSSLANQVKKIEENVLLERKEKFGLFQKTLRKKKILSNKEIHERMDGKEYEIDSKIVEILNEERIYANKCFSNVRNIYREKIDFLNKIKVERTRKIVTIEAIYILLCVLISFLYMGVIRVNLDKVEDSVEIEKKSEAVENIKRMGTEIVSSAKDVMDAGGMSDIIKIILIIIFIGILLGIAIHSIYKRKYNILLNKMSSEFEREVSKELEEYVELLVEAVNSKVNAARKYYLDVYKEIFLD